MTDLERWIAELERAPEEEIDALVERALPLLELHREAFARVVALLEREGAGHVVERMREDPLLASLLRGYGIEEGTAAPSLFDLARRAGAAPRHSLALVHLSEVPEGRALAVEVDEGVELVVARSGHGARVLRGRCPAGGASLDGARVEGGALECACHGRRYDLASGRALDGGPGLAALPATVEDGVVRVARDGG